MTHPSNLKVKRLDELDLLPAVQGTQSWLYAVQDNHDYKVDLVELTDAIVDEAAEDAAALVKDELAEPDGASLIGYGGTTVEDTLDTIVPLATTALQPGDPDTELVFLQEGAGAVDRTVREKLRDTVSVKDFGATGDGVTVDTAAFRDAILALDSIGGGTLLIPPGTYVINGIVELRSNINIIGYGAILTKTQSSPYTIFAALSGAAQGYGSSVENVTVKGLTFRGSFSDGIAICGFALHHAKNVLIEDCSFVEVVMNGHAIDACGCDGITVRNCVFEGFNPSSAGSYRAEAIQMDVSAAGAVSYPDDPASYDGLLTRNLTVEGCKFLPLTIGLTTYPCPNPVGAHATVEGQQYEGLRFTNNLIIDPIEDLSTDDTATGAVKGVIHFPALKNAVISDNVFIMQENRCVRAISLYSMTHGLPSNTDWSTSGHSPTTISPVLTQNVTIRGNVFRGFSNRSGIDTQHTIFLRGLATAPVENVTITDNKFEDAYRNAQNHLDVLGRYANGITVSGNSFTDTGTAVKSEWGNDWRAVGNTFLRCRAQPILVQDTDGFAMLSNTARQCGQAYRTQGDSKNITVVGNIFLDSTNTGVAAAGIQMAGNTTNFTVQGNTIVYPGTEVQGITAFNTSVNGVISGNIVTGYTTKVNVGASATNVTAVNNY